MLQYEGLVLSLKITNFIKTINCISSISYLLRYLNYLLVHLTLIVVKFVLNIHFKANISHLTEFSLDLIFSIFGSS